MIRRILLPCAAALLAAAGLWYAAAGRNRTTYFLLEGTSLETEVCEIRGKDEGLAVYVVAGIHGDETAGILAAERLKRSRIERGTLYILSTANGYGAENDQRKTEEERDLNRNFPGDPEGWDAERIAAAIYGDIEEKQPAVVLDLHEARAAENGKDALGDSLICQSLDGIGDMVLELLMQTAFTLYGSPPSGSINRTVTDELGIPVITVETFRGDEMEVRIEKHLEVTDFVLTYCGLS